MPLPPHRRGIAEQEGIVNKVWSNLRRPSVDPGLVAFAAVLTASLVLNARLGLDATAKPATRGETGFLRDTRLPDVVVAAPGEPDRPLTFARNTLLYIFSPGCEWSKGDYPNLKAIVQASGTNYDVLGLYAKPHDTGDDVSTYLASHPFPGKVVAVDLTRTKLPDDIVRRFRSTPQLLVVARGGLIRRSWSGALFGRRQAEAEQYFGLKLPGVSMVGGVAVLASDSAATR
jgi:hypothetical protein